MPTQAQLDLEHYGFVVDREAALAEQYPPLKVLMRERPSHIAQKARREDWERERSLTPTQRQIRAWQEAEVDRAIAERADRKARRTPDRYPRYEEADLVHEAVTNLRARYGEPSTFKENK